MMINNVIIFCIGKLYKGNSAGSVRTMNYAKLFADNGINVYFSYLSTKKIKQNHVHKHADHIYSIEAGGFNKKVHLFRNFFKSFLYVYRLVNFAKKLKGETAFILYPSNDPTLELPALLIIKTFYRFCIAIEINELRCAILQSNPPSIQNKFKNFLILIYNKLMYAYFKLNEYLSKYFDGLIVISTRLEAYFSDLNKNLIRIPILADASRVIIKSKPEFNFEKDAFIISFTGQVELKKEGIDTLIKTLGLFNKEFPNFELHLYGPVPKNAIWIFDSLVKNWSLENKVIFHGVVNQEEVMEILRKSHLLVLLRPSNRQNNFGFSTKLAEYMISGTPILLSDVSDNKLYIKDNFNGFIVESLEEEILFPTLKKIYLNYNSFKDTIPANSLETAKIHFDYRNYFVPLKAFLTKNRVDHEKAIKPNKKAE
jgi:glycosyltransferase involved in cell wall biosynthesis